MWHSHRLSSLVWESVTDGLLVKSLKEKPICYCKAVLFISPSLQRFGKVKDEQNKLTH